MPTFLLHLRQLILHNLATATAVIAVVVLVIYVQCAAHAFRSRRYKSAR